MRILPAALLAATLVMAFGGCFDHPLTAGPSRNINTWLLGVWQTQDDKGNELTATVLPKSASHCSVEIALKDAKTGKKQTGLFDGFISRIDGYHFLSLKLLTASPEAGKIGSYAFAHYEMMSPNEVRIRIPDLEESTGASSFQLRQLVRKKLKDNTLYPRPALVWVRISEVYWEKGHAPEVMQQLRWPSNANPAWKPVDQPAIPGFSPFDRSSPLNQTDQFRQPTY